MVVSFRIERKGRRYTPKPKVESTSVDDEVDDVERQLPEINQPPPAISKRSVDLTKVDGNHAENSDAEVSFIISMFPDGYLIETPSERNQNDVEDDLKVLCPYDIPSESLFTVIECGHLPGNFLDDIHCKYVNGTVLCEVRDYRKEFLTDACPSITKVSLKMSLDNVVKDIDFIADSSWEYGDILEAEARILNALQPKLFLDPTPNLERLCKEPTCIKLNVDVRGLRLKRLRKMSRAATAPESSNLRAGESSSKTGQPDFINLANQNVGQSSTMPINHSPEASNLREGVSKQVTGQSDYVNMTNHNVGQSSMAATKPTNHASESSNLRAGESISKTGQPDFMNLANHNVGQSSTRPIKHSPETSSLKVPDSRQVIGQSHNVIITNQNVGQSSMIATRPTNHASESSNLRVGDSRTVAGHPDHLNLANQNVGQSNMIATRPIDHAFKNSYMRAGDSRSITGQPNFVNLGNQNVGQSDMTATRPNNHALENSNLGAGNSRSLTGQPGFVNLASQNIGQSNMTATRPINHTPESSNLRGDSRMITGQHDFVNVAIQNVGQSNMIATRPTNHAPQGDSRLLTGPPSFVNLANQNVGQRNMIATKPVNHAPENSNLGAGDLRRITGQPGYVNLASQYVGRESNMIVARPTNRAPENSTLRAGDLRLITGPPGFVNPANQNVGRQNNLITTRPINHAPESSISASSSVFHESRCQNGVGNQPRQIQNNAPQISCTSSGHDMMKPNMSDGLGLIMPSFHGKRGYEGNQMSCMVNSNKRCRSNPDGNQSQQNSNRDEIQQLFDEIFNREKGQQGSRYNVKQEPLETVTMDRYEPNRVHQRLQQQQQLTRSIAPKQQLTRPIAPQQQLIKSIAPSNNRSQNLENNTKKEESFRVPVGRQFGAAAGSSEKGKSVVTSVAGIRSSNLSGKGSMQQPQMGENWRSSSLPKTHGVGSSSSSSVGNMIGPFTASSPIDGSMRDRFSAIGMLTVRFKLNCRKNKIDADYKPSISFPTQQLKHALFSNDNNDTHKDEHCIMPLSMSLVGGNINICKTRVLNFVKNERLLPTEDGFLVIPMLKTRLILSERASDGTVAMHLGELDDCDYLKEDHLLPTLANTHTADLLADQFCSLMFHEGYHLEDDHVEPKPMSTVEGSVNSSCWEDFEFFDFQEGEVFMNEVAKPLTNMPTAHPQGKGGLLAGVAMASSSSSSRSRESEPQSSLFQQQQEFQRSSAMISHSANPMPMGQKIPYLQQQQQHLVSNRASQLQQQSPMQRMEPRNANNRRMMGRGRGRSQLMGQNSMVNINQQGSSITSVISQQTLHSGPLTPIHAAFMATEPRMAHSASGGLVRHCSNLGGNTQMHLGSGSSGVSMLGSAINRVNHINRMPQTNVTGQPNLILGMNQNQNQNRYVNQQQLWVEPSYNIQTADLPPEQ